MIFGDVLTTLSLICGIPLTTWAMVIACRLMFPGLSDRAASRLQTAPFRQFGLGLVLTFVLVVLGIIFVSSPVPAVKFVGLDIIGFVLTLSIVGCAGLGTIAASRIHALSSDLSEYACFVRGSAFVIVACMSPLVGWLFIAPIALITAVGAGFNAVFRRASVQSSAVI